jgi:hypothetical protein
MRKYIYVTLVTLFVSFNIHAQAPKIKFGKVSKDELLMKYYEADTSADAVILADIGSLKFTYNNSSQNKGFVYLFERHLRIKIFNKNGYEYANNEILLRHNKSRKEEIKKFKAYTFNLENGKVNSSKLSKSDLMTEEYNDKINISKFSMIDIKEGSIIDIQYSIQSDYLYYLREWKFQYDIPVKWSSYEVEIPEYYKYKHFFDGVQDLDIKDESYVNRNFTITWEIENRSGLPGYVEGQPSIIRQSEDLMLQCKVHKYAAKNIEAFKEEPYMASTDNYIFKLYFELEQIKIPRRNVENYAKSWESVNKDMVESSNFGVRLNQTNFIKNILSDIIEGCTSDEEKALNIHTYVKQNIKWTGNHRVFAESSLKNVHNDKAGSSAEINLLLVAMLREAGLNAHPVLYSTRSNGMVNKYQPGISQFNSVIAYALINQKNYLFDGTSITSQPNILPKRCLNGEGLVISENFSDWININPTFISQEVVGGSFSIDPEINFVGKISTKKTKYYAYDFINELAEYTDNENYIEEYQNKNQNIEIIDYSINNTNDVSQALKANYSVKISDIADVMGGLIIFKPLNIYSSTYNPFKEETRIYPVNFIYPYKETYVMNYQIPEGYDIEEMPENIQLITPDKSASFLFNLVRSGNIVRLTCKKIISKTLYMPNEYQMLRDFYNQVIAKENEKIILKKI